MKKRWLPVLLLFLTLFLVICPAHAAVVSGGTQYLWYTEDGEKTRNNNGEVTGFGGQKFFLSNDGGVSYTQLPEFQETSRQSWTDYDVRLSPLEDGGLRIEGRSVYGEGSAPYTLYWDYSAARLAELLAKAEPNPVQVLADNGSVAVGIRLVSDFENGQELFAPNYSAERQKNWETQLVWSADRETWGLCEYPEELTVSQYSMDAWWDNGTFYLREYYAYPNGYTSVDGIHWTAVDLLPVPSGLCLTADWGRYHFEVVMPRDDPDEWYNEVYLMESGERDAGVLLPHMGEGIRANGIGVNEFTAEAGPNDTVVLTVSNQAGATFSLDYPISSLDWCLENLSAPFRDKTQPAALVSDGTVSLAKVAEHFRDYNTYRQEGELLRNDGSGWRKVETPFSCVFKILPYNGKTFMALDTATGRQRLYASVDGLNWVEVDTLRPPSMDESKAWGYAAYTFFWTGEHYYVGMKAGEYRHGMVGMSGGNWYGKNTLVWFLDENFEIISSYDFGRLVERVGYLDGTYYAEVVKNEGTSDHQVSGYSTSNTVYRSTDGKSWTPLPKEYMELNVFPEKSADEYNDDIPDILFAPVGGSLKGNFPTGDPQKPLRTAAQMGKWRFVLDKDSYRGTWAGLLRENASDFTGLPELNEAIQANWITPGEIEAEQLADGRIRVTVTDLSTPSMKCSVIYTPEELAARPVTTMGYRVGWTADNSKPGVADLTLVDMANGEKELVYRNEKTEGKFMWYESVPWSNSTRLLPFSGKDFMVLDLADGKLWRSEDAQTWQEATGDFLVLSRGYETAKYRLLWTGKNYLACCYLDNGKTGDEKRVSGEVSKVFLLDEDLNVVSSHDFGCGVERLGIWKDVFYAEVGPESWDERGRYGVIVADGQAPVNTIWRSDDGVNWEKTDIIQVRNCLRTLGE